LLKSANISSSYDR